MMVSRSTIYKQKRKFFALVSVSLCLPPPPSNISQNDAEVLEKQWQEMQRRHEEEERLLAQLEEVAKLRQAE